MATAKTLKTVNKSSPFSISTLGILSFSFLSGIDAVAQSVKTRINTFQTEFYYNSDFGVDWYGTVLSDSAQAVEKEAALNDMVADTNGVSSLSSSDLIIDKSTQKQYYTATVVSGGVQTDITVSLDED